MLPIKDMQFLDTKEPRRTVVKGMLRFTSVAQIENDRLHSAQFDMLEEIKHRMKRELWQRVYGDLLTPFHDLSITMMKYSSEAEHFRVQDLVRQIEALLTMPKE